MTLQQPSHCRIVSEPEDPATEAIELASGDTIALGVSRKGLIYLSLDDIGKADEVGLPTGELLPAEARLLAGRLLRFATSAECR